MKYSKIYVYPDDFWGLDAEMDDETKGQVYISKESLLSFLLARIKEIEQEKSTVNTYTMTGGSKMNCLRGIQKELKQIIETFK